MGREDSMPIELNDLQRLGRVRIVLDNMEEIIEDLRNADPPSPPLSKKETAERFKNGAPDDPTLPLRDAIGGAVERLDAVRTILSDTME